MCIFVSCNQANDIVRVDDDEQKDTIGKEIRSSLTEAFEVILRLKATSPMLIPNNLRDIKPRLAGCTGEVLQKYSTDALEENIIPEPSEPVDDEDSRRTRHLTHGEFRRTLKAKIIIAAKHPMAV